MSRKRVLTLLLLLLSLSSYFLLFAGGSVKVYADGVTLQSTGYDLHPFEGNMTMTMFTDHNNVQWSAVMPDDGNVYTFDNVAQSAVDQLTFSAIAGQSYGFDVLINQSLYDYYFVVTVFADNATNSDFTFYPNYLSCQTYPCDIGSKWYGFQEIVTKHFDTVASRGFTIVGRLNRQITSSRVVQISMSTRDSDLYYTVPANLRFKCNVIEVPKNAVTSADIQSIIGKIDEQTDVISGSIEDAADKIADQIEKQYEYSESDDLGVGSVIEEYEEKLGVLTFATDTMLDMLDLFDPANAGEPEIVVPSWSMNIQGDDYEIWQEYRFNLKQIDAAFPFLMRTVRLITVSLFYLAIVGYIQKIYERWFLAR